MGSVALMAANFSAPQPSPGGEAFRARSAGHGPCLTALRTSGAHAFAQHGLQELARLLGDSGRAQDGRAQHLHPRYWLLQRKGEAPQEEGTRAAWV
jgi:hypothetical protein